MIAKNTVYNLLGYGIPLLFAIFLIPPLIRGLGDERFGILNLAWIIIGYFSFLDFGIGKAVTKLIAEKLGANESDEIPAIFWTSLLIMLVVSFIVAIFAYAVTPSLVQDFFNISSDLQVESINTFYLLSLSIPIVSTTAGLRGLLEAYQKFGMINIIRTFLGVLSFLGPLVCLIFTTSLFWIVLVLIFIRIIVWFVYLFQCFGLSNKVKQIFQFDKNQIKPILKFSGWITISNLIVPVMIYLDRFLIGAIDSASAITYYATPYEVVTKLLLVPGALTGVLFPAFSANYSNDPVFTKKLSSKAVKYIFFLLYPLILIIVTFSYEGMYLWLGKDFAVRSSLILQLLAIGVLFNSLAYIPFSYMQGIGRPDLTAKIQFIELPVYIISLWFAISYYGIKGAAFVWMLRMIMDAILLFWLSKKINKEEGSGFVSERKNLTLIGIIIISIIPAFVLQPYIRLTMILVIITIFLTLYWKSFFELEERNYLIAKFRNLIKFNS